MDWIFAPPPKKKKKLVLNSNPQRDGMWRWDLGEVIRSWGQAFRNGISVLRKEAPESPLLICTNTARRSIIYEPRRWFSLDSESASTLILDFPGFRTVTNKFMLFTSPSVYDIFVMAAQTHCQISINIWLSLFVTFSHPSHQNCLKSQL